MGAGRCQTERILLAAIASVVLSFSVFGETIDPKQYKPSGNALGGSVNRDQYIFSYCSDFRENNDVRYIYFIINRNKQQSLPAQWVRASMDYQWVAEDGCWENDWAINQSDVGQDKSAILEYGSRRPLKTAKAAIYEDQPKKPTHAKKARARP